MLLRDALTEDTEALTGQLQQIRVLAVLHMRHDRVLKCTSKKPKQETHHAPGSQNRKLTNIPDGQKLEP